jgi:hypothetical protein
VTYAAETSVSVEASRMEIERTLQRYGASAFMYGWSAGRAVVQFAAANRQIKFEIVMPDKNERRFVYHSRGQRTPEAALKEWEQACRQRWRALNLVIKAKLEAVASGISEFEEEFLANIVLPDGSTAGQFLRPQIAHAYETAEMPSLLPALGRG